MSYFWVLGVSSGCWKRDGVGSESKLGVTNRYHIYCVYIYIYITMVRNNSISWHIAVIYYD